MVFKNVKINASTLNETHEKSRKSNAKTNLNFPILYFKNIIQDKLMSKTLSIFMPMTT